MRVFTLYPWWYLDDHKVLDHQGWSINTVQWISGYSNTLRSLQKYSLIIVILCPVLQIIFIQGNNIIIKIQYGSAICLPDHKSLAMGRGGNRGQKMVGEEEQSVWFIWIFENQVTLQNCVLSSIPQRKSNAYRDSRGRSIQLGSKKNKIPNLKFPITQKTLNSGQTLL